MKAKLFFLPILFPLIAGLLTGTAFPDTTEIEKMSGPYLSQKPPGKTPEIFAPNIISTGKHEGCLIFSKDGRRLLLEIGSNVYEMQEKNGHWTKPKIVSFQSYWNVNDITFSPDGKSAFFASRRPLKNGGMTEDYSNLWKSEMKGGEWTKPIPFPASINTPLHESYTTASNNGAQYFFRYIKNPGGSENGDLYVSYFKNGKFSEAEPLGENFNTPYHEWDPYIAPDESYIIFCSLKPEGFGQDDFYISFKKPDGSWTVPMNMGEEINSPASENRPFVTLDGKYLFFSSNRINDSFRKSSTLSDQDGPGTGNRDVYWVDASIIEDFRSAAFKAEETVPNFETVKLADNMFLFQGDFANVLAFDSANGIVLIDTPSSSVTNLMYKEFYKSGQKQVRTLVTTHYHSDHTGANEFFGKRGVSIISHINTKKRMRSEQYNDFFDYRVPAAPGQALPKQVFKDELILQIANEELLLSYTPGHTDGDIIAYFRKANVIHMGDIFFNGYIPSCDVNAGGSIDKLIESVEKTLSMINNSTIVIPGHGEPANKATLEDYLSFLKALRNEVSKGIEKGLSADDIIKTRPDFIYKRKWLNVSQTPDILVKNIYLDLIRFKK